MKFVIDSQRSQFDRCRKRDNKYYWRLFRFKQKREKMEAEAAKRRVFQDGIKKIIMFQNFHEKVSATGTKIQI